MGGPRLRMLLVLLVLAALTLTVLDTRTGSSPFEALRRGATTVVGPAQQALGGATAATARAVGRVGRLGASDADVTRLQRENAALRAQLHGTDGLRRSEAELRALLKTPAVERYPVVPARVVAVGSSLGFEWTATLDAGSRDGVKPDQTVLSGDGLVGRTKRVGPWTSTVVLLVDPDFTVGARLARQGGIGLATGDGAHGLRCELVDADAQVTPGDVVTTSGSGTFVPDVPVGRVTALAPRASALTRAVTVAPFADVRALDLVGVIVGPARTAARTALAP
jgi:rod shape-determining protein MreC